MRLVLVVGLHLIFISVAPQIRFIKIYWSSAPTIITIGVIVIGRTAVLFENSVRASVGVRVVVLVGRLSQRGMKTSSTTVIVIVRMAVMMKVAIVAVHHHDISDVLLRLLIWLLLVVARRQDSDVSMSIAATAVVVVAVIIARTAVAGPTQFLLCHHLGRFGGTIRNVG